MLETIREFAAERLDKLDESSELRDRHAAWFVALGERAFPELHARRGSEWLDRLEAEHANLRAALDHLLARNDVDRVLRLTGAIWTYWQTRGHWTEGRRFLAAALALAGDVEPELLVDVFWGAALLALWQGDLDEGELRTTQLLELSRKHGLRRGEAVALEVLGIAAAKRGDNERARTLTEESVVLARAVDDGWLLSVATNNLGDIHMEAGDYARAVELFEESLAIGEARGDLDRRARALTNLGFAIHGLGDLPRALDLYLRGLTAAREIGLVEVVLWALQGIAWLEADSDNAVTAANLLGWTKVEQSRLGAGSTEHEIELDDRALAKLLDALGPDQLESELAAGAAMSLEVAIGLALGRSGSEASTGPA
jgi:tetratricopeptide (TPR) repeat protein